MQVKRPLTLLAPGLLAALALGHVETAQASAIQHSAKAATVSASTQIKAPVLVAHPPPDPRQRQRWQQAFDQGYRAGRAACKSRKYNPAVRGEGASFRHGFLDGYNSGFRSCRTSRIPGL
ncbi:hypothetical protein [Nonomuraea lactucae]|uniref:hypothetical protein n=1 Tax=Nonomuraea lactucae TaxID=2249762 RepID=UPI0013B3A7A6|nr:hypothetical protein [Nonomuraea lactucae]